MGNEASSKINVAHFSKFKHTELKLLDTNVELGNVIISNLNETFAKLIYLGQCCLFAPPMGASTNSGMDLTYQNCIYFVNAKFDAQMCQIRGQILFGIFEAGKVSKKSNYKNRKIDATFDTKEFKLHVPEVNCAATVFLANKHYAGTDQLVSSVMINLFPMPSVEITYASHIHKNIALKSGTNVTLEYKTINYGTYNIQPLNPELQIGSKKFPAQCNFDLYVHNISAKIAQVPNDDNTNVLNLVENTMAWKACVNLLKGFKIAYLQNWYVGSSGMVVFQEPVNLNFGNAAIPILSAEFIQNHVYLHSSNKSISLIILPNGLKLEGRVHHTNKFILSEQLLAEFGFSLECNDFYRPMIGNELVFRFEAMIPIKSNIPASITSVNECTVRLEPQRLLCYAFKSLWEVTVPQRNACYHQPKPKRMELMTNRMAYSSWKFNWLYHSSSALILRTGSSSSTKVSTFEKIPLTLNNIVQFAHRLVPYHLGGDVLGAPFTSISLDVVKMELEARNATCMVYWNDSSDEFWIKIGTQVISPKYDSAKRLMPASAYGDISFIFK